MPRTKNSMINKTFLEKFWGKVDKTGDCWEWTGSIKPKGYGQFMFRGKSAKAHRVAWIITFGEIPELPNSDYRGTCVLHKCDNRKCVNPDHLFLGTNLDNLTDMKNKGRGRQRTRNITDEERTKIQLEYSRGNTTHKDLSLIYGYSVDTIGLITRNKRR